MRHHSLDGVHCNRPNLDLLLAAGRQKLGVVDTPLELGGVVEHALTAEHVRNQVVREDRQLVEVSETAGTAAIERQREIPGGDLCALVERHLQAPVPRHISVKGHLTEALDESLGAATRGRDQAFEAPARARLDEAPQLRERTSEELHQLSRARVPQILSEDAGAVRRAEHRELRSVPRPFLLKALSQRPGDREVPGEACGLAKHREPARTEVDGVERDHEREGRLRAAELEMGGIDWRHRL